MHVSVFVLTHTHLLVSLTQQQVHSSCRDDHGTLHIPEVNNYH